MHFDTKKLTRCALIAAVYVALTMLSNVLNLAFGPIQLRFSEALTVLPFLLPVFTNYLSIFASYPLIRKYMVEPIEQMSPQEREALMQPSSKKLEKQARKARKAREKDQYYNS